jgi:hypothetical protein
MPERRATAAEHGGIIAENREAAVGNRLPARPRRRSRGLQADGGGLCRRAQALGYHNEARLRGLLIDPAIPLHRCRCALQFRCVHQSGIPWLRCRVEAGP